jgi:plasmid stabilization system protein ParE
VSTRVVIRAAAERDIQHALDWYMENAPEQVGRLTADLRETIDRIRASPRLFRVVYRDIRRAALHRFPYLVWLVHFDEIDAVHVLAVTHQRQDPERVLKLVDGS